ncbi:hypothetical protein C4580_05305 [Candidatus Woesearchaeota archaeon]|nr:MAG: hypothetical protein C4580_05305 [Candidatus Woesearchaeota archaeon]
MGKNPAFGTIIRHRGFFNYNELLTSIQGWYSQYDFTFQVSELKQKMGDTGFEVRGIYEADKKITNYIKYHIKIRFTILNMKDVELAEDGKKKKMQEGTVWAEISSELETDWQGRYKGHKFTEWMGEVLEKYILKYKIADYYDDALTALCLSLAGSIKKALKQEL